MPSAPLAIWLIGVHFISFALSAVEEREYSILLVMSELSTVRCDRALGPWIAGTRASSVDGELPWGAVADEPCGGRR